MVLFFFQVFVPCSEVVYTLILDADQVAKNLKCLTLTGKNAMTEDTLYALSQARQCHITPEELEVSQTKIILNNKHFRKEFITTKCRKKHQRQKNGKWHCGLYDHSSIDHTNAGVTNDL